METRIAVRVREVRLSDPEAVIRTPLASNPIGLVGILALALTLGLLLLTLASVAGAERLDDPIELGSIDTPDFALGVAVVGGLAYVADQRFGLRVIDVSNPAVPVEVGSIDTPGEAVGVSVLGGLSPTWQTIAPACA
jgi:hypothetical protein